MAIDENQLVKAKWNHINKKVYQNMGYDFTKYGDEFYVVFKDLKFKTDIKIEVICDYCNKKYYPTYKAYTQKHDNGIIKDACSCCANKKMSESTLSKRANKYFNILNRICEDNGYVLITKMDEYTDLQMRIKFICPKHGLQNMPLNDLMQGHLCFDCGREKAIMNSKVQQDEVKKRIESVKGNTWINEGEYTGSMDRNLWIKCSCGNKFCVNLRDYKIINRCPTCAKSESTPARNVRLFLEELGIDYTKEKIFKECKDVKPLPFDFYLPEYNLIIEYDGEGHYLESFYIQKGVKNPLDALHKTQYHDKIKDEYCKKHNIYILRIPYWEKK